MKSSRAAHGSVVLLAIVTATAALSTANAGALPRSAPAGAPRAAAAAADPNAVIKIGVIGVATSFDPQKVQGANGVGNLGPIWDTLTVVDPHTFEIKPELAQSWEFTPDNQALLIHMRPGPTFQDGTPIDAAAVKATIERGKTLDGSTLKGFLASISSVDVVDATTARLNLTPGFGAEVPYLLSTLAGVMISPKAIQEGRDLALAPGDALSGAYRVKSFQPGTAMSFERRPDKFWDPTASRAKGFEFSAIADFQAMLNALKSGAIDLGQFGSDSVVRAVNLGKESGFQTSRYIGTITNEVGMRITGPPAGAVADEKVRQAIGMAIDKNAIGNGLFSGYCTPTNQLLPKGNPAYIPGYDGATYNKKKAIAAIKSYGQPVSVELSYYEAFNTTAEAVGAQLQAVGVKVTLQPGTATVVGTNFYLQTSQAYIGALSARPTDASLAISGQYVTGMSLLKGSPLQAQVADEISKANSPALSVAARGKALQGIEKEVLASAVMIPICRLETTATGKSDLRGLDNMPGAEIGLFNPTHIYRVK